MLSMLPSSLLSPLVPPVDDALLYAVAPVADAGRCGGSERRVAAVRTRPSTSRRWWSRRYAEEGRFAVAEEEVERAIEGRGGRDQG